MESNKSGTDYKFMIQEVNGKPYRFPVLDMNAKPFSGNFDL